MSTDTADIVTRFGSGRAVQRIEDEGLLKGVGQYTDDVVPAGQLRALFVRSPHPHARIVAVDTANAAAMPGVVKVVSGADLVAAGVKPIPALSVLPDRSGVATAPRRILAHERVRYVGEAVALVIAQTLQQARDAAEAVGVEYEELPHVVDLEEAVTPGAPAVFEGAQHNVAAQLRHGDRAQAAQAFAQAAHVVQLEVVNQRVAPLSIEPRSVLAWVAEDGRLTLRMSTQMPSGVRNTLCDLLGLAREQVRVTVADVGGGFGMKTGAYPEDVAGVILALAAERPP